MIAEAGSGRVDFAAMAEHGIGPIDLVVVNLYPFEQTIAEEGTRLAEALEQIDILETAGYQAAAAISLAFSTASSILPTM